MHKTDLANLASDRKRDSFARHQSIEFDFRSPTDVFCKNIVISSLYNPLILSSAIILLRKLWLPVVLASLLILPPDPTWASVNVTYRPNKTLFSMMLFENRGSRTRAKLGRSFITDEADLFNFSFTASEISLNIASVNVILTFVLKPFKIFSRHTKSTVAGAGLAFGERCCFLKIIANWPRRFSFVVANRKLFQTGRSKCHQVEDSLRLLSRISHVKARWTASLDV